ncbi:MAG TPA: endonuclease/exonuclease/phosphatase family protein [Spirochaetota bacterium]|nr:endonuclease/exonuclease/phosphatase family protein [Spirochaetota bacterium]
MGKRSISLFIFLVVVMTAIGCGRKQNETGAVRENLRLMSINIWSGLDYKGTLIMGEYETPERRETRFQGLLAEIRRLDPDIIGINEANFLPDYIQRLAKEIDYDYIYHVGVSGLHIGRVGLPWNLREGDAILAKKDLGLSIAGRKQLSGGGFIGNTFSFHTQDATQVLVGRMKVNGKDLYAAVTHWHASPPGDGATRTTLKRLNEKWSYGDAQYAEAQKALASDNEWRMSEAAAMAQYLDTLVPCGAPLVVMGDFNAEIGSPEMRIMADKGYSDVWSRVSRLPGYTWNPAINMNIKSFYLTDNEKRFDSLYEHLNSINEATGKRIDFILLNESLGAGPVVDASVCFDRPYEEIHPSDHFGVFAVVAL